jgi:hypothetical protein
MARLHKWIALILLAAFLPATAMAQSCATRCAFSKQMMSLVQISEPQQLQSEQKASEHCSEKSADTCPFAAVCDFANLFVMYPASIEFSPAPLAVTPEFLPTDFMSVVHPPALRPPAV